MKIYNTLKIFLILRCIGLNRGSKELKTYYDEEGAPRAENIVSHEGKKSVLLIGDSIRQGYCATVKDLLSDIADVYYPEDNCRFAQYIIASISSYVNLVPDPDSVDVVYWNSGQWDTAHFRYDDEPLNSLEQYVYAIGRVQNIFRREFKNAKIIFATTTPMNPVEGDIMNPRTTEEIMRYNKAACELVLKLGGEIDDLFSLMKDKDSSWYLDYCHYTAEGFRYIGQHVADYLRNAISHGK